MPRKFLKTFHSLIGGLRGAIPVASGAAGLPVSLAEPDQDTPADQGRSNGVVDSCASTDRMEGRANEVADSNTSKGGIEDRSGSQIASHNHEGNSGSFTTFRASGIDEITRSDTVEAPETLSSIKTGLEAISSGCARYEVRLGPSIERLSLMDYLQGTAEVRQKINSILKRMTKLEGRPVLFPDPARELLRR